MNVEEGYVYKVPVNRKLLIRKLMYTPIFLAHHLFNTCYGISIIISNYDSEIGMIEQAIAHFPAYGTHWNFLFQITFLSLSLIYDVLQWFGKHETKLAQRLRYLRDVIFSGMVFPFTLYISSMFWAIFLVDRELVFPEIYDQIIPWWFIHCFHTNIVIVVLIETLIQPRRHPIDGQVEFLLVTAVGILYAIVYYSIYFFTHRWLYGVFAVMTWWQVCLSQLLIWGACFCFYFIQFPINRMFHKEEEVQSALVPTAEGKESTGVNRVKKESLKNRKVEKDKINSEKF